MEKVIDRHRLEASLIALRRMRMFLAVGVMGAIALPVLFVQWGFALWEVFLLQAIFNITIVIIEVPSGYLADRWGRRNALIVGAWFMVVAWVIYLLAAGFILAAVAEILLSCAFSFI